MYGIVSVFFLLCLYSLRSTLSNDMVLFTSIKINKTMTITYSSDRGKLYGTGKGDISLSDLNFHYGKKTN